MKDVPLGCVPDGQRFLFNGRWYVKEDSNTWDLWCMTEDGEDSASFTLLDIVQVEEKE